MEEAKDVTGESSTPSALESAIASSPEVEQEATQQEGQAQAPTAEQGTEQPVVEQEEGRIPYSRFKEKVDEANFYKELLSRQPQAVQPIQQQPVNPYANMTPEEERFWRAVDERAEKVAERKLSQITPVIEAGRMEIAQSKVAQFRQSHPDIKPNSPEELEIAQRISAGYHPDDAYWAIMGPRGIRVAEEKGKQIVKQQIEAKKKANVGSTTGISQQAVAPSTKLSYREYNSKLYDDMMAGKL
jgi:hypothetical protein